MYVKNTNFAIYLGIAALVGFGASFLFGTNGFQDGLGSGDISKASRYNNQKADPSITLMEEKLQSDKEFFDQTKSIVDALKSRVAEINKLTDETMSICSDIPELQGHMDALASLSAKTYNTNLAFETVSTSLDKLADGKSAPEYEQASNNAMVGVQKISGNMEFGKKFIEGVDEYLSDKALDSETNAKLLDVAANWATLCAEDAVIMNDQANLKYWQNKFSDAVASAQANAFSKEFNQEFNGAVEFAVAEALSTAGSLQNDTFKNVFEVTELVVFQGMNPSQQKVIQNAFPQNRDIQNAFSQNRDIQNAFSQNRDIQNAFSLRQDIQNFFQLNNNIQNLSLSGGEVVIVAFE